MHIGLVGLGKMGANMRTRLRNAGIDVTGYDNNPDVTDVSSLAALVDALPVGRRVVWVMVPAGEVTRAVISELGDLLREGDIVVDQSRFTPENERPEDFDGKFWRTYNVLPDALLVNWQSSDFTIRPADDGHGIDLSIQPFPEGLVIDNRVRLTSGRCVGQNRQVDYQIDPARSEVRVGPREAAERTELVVRDLRWLAPRTERLRAHVQVRHRGTPIAAEIAIDGDRATARLAEPTVAAKGQAAVFYADDRVLAGGWIAG